MRRRNNQNKKMLFLLIFLVLFALSIAYAILTEQLTISNTVSYDAMKWEVGFSKTEDNGGTITSTSSIINDGKSITVNCDLGKNTGQETCIVKATITNNGTFDIGLASDPLITYDDTYIHTLTFKWEDHPTYLNSTVLERGFVENGTSQNVILTIKTKNLTKDMLPEDDVSIPVTITLDFKEWWEDKLPATEDLAMLLPSECSFNGDGLLYAGYPNLDFTCAENSYGETMMEISEYLKNITFEDQIDVPENALATWNLSATNNGRVIVSIVLNEEYTTDSTAYFDAYVQSDTQLYANPDMSWWFFYPYLDSVNGLELLDTSMTTNMEGMFAFAGVGNQDVLALDLSNFDTSGVTNMRRMFESTGMFSEDFLFDVSKFDTSKVTDMSFMFSMTGVSDQNFELAVGNFDTKNVTNMSFMFGMAGYNSSIISLDVSNWDTGNVTDMSVMFYETGCHNSTFTLDTSHFDTSNVIDMTDMFYRTGYNSTNLVTSITIRNPNVTSYSGMFYDVATEPGSQFTVNYTSETSDLVDQMISTKSTNSNVVKGVAVN